MFIAAATSAAAQSHQSHAHHARSSSSRTRRRLSSAIADNRRAPAAASARAPSSMAATTAASSTPRELRLRTHVRHYICPPTGNPASDSEPSQPNLTGVKFGRMDNIRGKTIAITGAARGIGYATAKALLERGARVVIGDRDVALQESAVASSPSSVRSRAIRSTSPTASRSRRSSTRRAPTAAATSTC